MALPCRTFPLQVPAESRTMMSTILNLVLALRACGIPAGRSTVCPACVRTWLPPTVMSTSPSRTCTMTSKGAVCSDRACPTSKANTVTLPPLFLTSVRLTTAPSW